ncbi:hypothetical protein [Clostridium sp.]|uniref:hypothetical protein n=1 Tax=Clostridium sp. TaxID=1506 RepID=UPI0025BE9343|nr:hypothetical protein [Clostridium sp.]
MEEIQQALLTALTMIATVSIGVGAKYLCSLLKRLGDKAEVQTSKIEDEKAEILLKNTLDKVEALIEDSIHYTEENLVKELKLATEDGKLTLEEGKEVLQTTAENVYAKLSLQTVNLLQETFDNLMIFIEERVQNVFDRMKKYGEI